MKLLKKTIAAVTGAGLLLTSACASPVSSRQEGSEDTEEPAEISAAEKLLAQMTLEEKIAQMIIPAIRTWNGENVTNLADVPDLAEALRRHPYGGIILFGANIVSTKQTAELVMDLQENNMTSEAAHVHIPYFMPVDQEGGIVTRLTSGSRMNGNMAVAATPDAEENAVVTGTVIGEELAALGFNVDFAPDIDVNNNPDNPVIGTRSFSDDPNIVAKLGTAYTKGLSQCGIIGTYKHFPGHGDTATDSHIGTPSVEKTYDELKQNELIPFAQAVKDGAEMIMTAHITFPAIDEEMVFGDGVTKGYYPATMSRKMITEILRKDLGFDGVVVTDALEMDAIRTAGLVEGETDSVQYHVNLAEKVINAGVDILLLPMDLKNAEIVQFYDDYISGITEKVQSGVIPEERIDESVLRILTLKDKYDILGMDPEGADREQIVSKAMETVGSDAHHETELAIARKAVTLVKNEQGTLPVGADAKNVVLLGRTKEDCVILNYTADRLKQERHIPADTDVYVDYYYDPNADNSVHYTEEMKQKVAAADVVIGLTKVYSLSAMGDSSAQYIGIHSILTDTHASGSRFVLLSDNLPYDCARYTDADAILLAYMGSGLDMDPSARRDGSANMMAVNANVIAAVEILFGAQNPVGRLPVRIPVIVRNEDGTLSYGQDELYGRGHGLSYE